MRIHQSGKWKVPAHFGCLVSNLLFVFQHHVMWADFLSHFSEIGLINDGAPDLSHYEVIKQKPSAHAHKNEEEKKEEAKPADATTNFMNEVKEDEENKNEHPAFSRRISKLDDVGKF